MAGGGEDLVRREGSRRGMRAAAERGWGWEGSHEGGAGGERWGGAALAAVVGEGGGCEEG